MSAETSTESLPASFLRRHRFDDGEIEALSKYARFRDGDPARLWTFGAHEIVVRGLEINPPYTFDEDDDLSTMRAFYTGYETNTIVYFLETWAEEAQSDAGFSPNYLAWQLHELTHWAVDEEDNETEPDHWERWNSVLGDVVHYVMSENEVK